jgi:hypothetical protein
MAKTRKLTIVVDEDLYRKIKDKSVQTGVPFSVVARRALENWVMMGEMPPVPPETEREQPEQD